MSYLEERRKINEQKALKSLQQNQVKRDEFLAKMSNPDSNVDEFASLIRWLLLPLFSLWVWYLGYIYTTNALAGVVEPWQATLLALALPASIQILKIYAAKKTLRAFHFKWYDRSGQEMWFWIFSGVLVVLMFAWSLKISIFDVKDTASDNFIASNTENLDERIEKATASIDAQIAALNTGNADASTMKTKKGKIAWSGQDIMMKNSTTLSSLADQRKLIVDEITANHKEVKLKTEDDAKERGNFFQRFGGFGELGEIIFCLLLGLAEAINRNNNLKRLEVQGKTDTNAQNNPLQDWTKHQPNGSPISNEAPTTRPIGFRWDGYGQTPVQPVTHKPPPVSQPSQPNPIVIGSDQILLTLRTRLMADIPNLLSKNGRPETVSARINREFDKCYEAICNPEFSPSMETGIKVYGYLMDEAIPALNGVGWPYERDMFFLQRLLEVIPRQAEVPAA